jgi:FkbM family methyltransferase
VYWKRLLKKFSECRAAYIAFTRVKGHNMGIYLTNNEISNTLFIYGFYEENETEMFEKIIKAGDTVLDISANIGYYTLIFAKLVGKNGRVFAFEPEPTNFALLKRNVRMNSYNNVVLEQKAVSNKTGKVKLYISENPGLHRIYNSYDGRKFIEVEAICLDDYFKNYDKNIDLLKWILKVVNLELYKE